jgi:hypothetical protein
MNDLLILTKWMFFNFDIDVFRKWRRMKKSMPVLSGSEGRRIGLFTRCES